MVVSIGTCSEAGGTMGKETEIAPYRYGDGTGIFLDICRSTDVKGISYRATHPYPKGYRARRYIDTGMARRHSLISV